jgi:hypothetical protein
MKKYIRCHLVEATPMTRGAYNKKRGWTIPKDENPKDKGYLVKYPDGYVSWCPKAQFEAAGRPVDGMTFGMAIEAMKAGKKVARAGWNDKGMYLWLLPAANVKAEWCKEEHLKALAEQNGGEFECLGSIRMKTADNKVLTGWLSSQTDMLSEDWVIVD